MKSFSKLRRSVNRIFEMAVNRRGSQIAEASLVYPIIIAVSVISVAAMVHFYSCSAIAAAMSIDARSTADLKADSVIRNGYIYNALRKNYDDSSDDEGYYTSVYSKPASGRDSYSIEEKNGLLYGSVTGSYTERLSMSGMFNISRNDTHVIKRSSVNEAQLIWKKQLIRDIAGSPGNEGEDQ